MAVLAAGDIRLLRSAWLLAPPHGYRIVWRQELEALEANELRECFSRLGIGLC